MTAAELAALLRNLDEAATDAWKQHGERPTSANRKLFITAIADRDVALRNNLPVIVAFLERLAEAEADADRLADRLVYRRQPRRGYDWLPRDIEALRLHDAAVARRSEP